MTNIRIARTQTALRLTYGSVAFIAGADKFFNVLTQWDRYLSPMIADLLPIGGQALMGTVGLIEMAVGVAILTRWTRLGAHVAAAWLLLIAVNIALTGQWLDVAVRDVVMAVGAWTLGQLTTATEPATESHLAAVGVRI
jgi:hypothetical protein